MDARLEQENISKDELWKKMEEADPTKNKQYVNWLVKAFQFGSKIEDLLSRGKDSLERFEQLKLKKKLKPEHSDIGRFQKLTDLESILRTDYPEGPSSVPTNKGEYIELVNDSNMRVIEILDKDSACYYGRGTQWCTAAKNNNMYDYYSSEEGRLFVFIPKKPKYPGEKYQLYFSHWYEDIQFNNEKDEKATNAELARKYIERYILPTIPERGRLNFIGFDSNATEDEQIAAVRESPISFKHIQNPSEKLQLIAVETDGMAISDIINPPEKLQLAAVRENIHAFSLIKNPTENVKKLIRELKGKAAGK
jgi:hypothetical protein